MRRRKPPEPAAPIKTEAEVEYMRRAGRIVALALRKMGEVLQPGITTGELNEVAETTIRSFGATPAFLNYRGYPATACISINEEVVHGIPGPRTVKTGDLVSVDLGAILDGWYADSAYTFPVGEVSELAKRLMAAGQGALDAGIAAAKAGNRVRDIGAAIFDYTKARGFTVVQELSGHGIGRKLHEEPHVPNYPDRSGTLVLQPGMTLAIEPMVNAGGHEVRLLEDGWTFVTRDVALSVHYEHTVLIREDGPEILTALR
ncbi:MAG: type I methionyl aminopeptidase [Armatimonadota bacterium]